MKFVANFLDEYSDGIDLFFNLLGLVLITLAMIEHDYEQAIFWLILFEANLIRKALNRGIAGKVELEVSDDARKWLQELKIATEAADLRKKSDA
jgi:hypothetical protein